MHGFDHMFMTQEVAPTSTTNCACDPAWEAQCRFGHNMPWACTNYWTEDPAAPEVRKTPSWPRSWANCSLF